MWQRRAGNQGMQKAGKALLWQAAPQGASQLLLDLSLSLSMGLCPSFFLWLMIHWLETQRAQVRGCRLTCSKDPLWTQTFTDSTTWLWVTPLLFSLFLVSRMYTEVLCICCCALRYIFILSSQMFKWCSHIVLHSQWEAGNSQLLGYHYNLSVCSCAVQLGKTCEETLAAARCSFKCVPHTTADNMLAIFCKHSQQACSTLCL